MNRTHSGFTMIEMMVSVAILALVTLYLTDMLVRQSRTYQVVDQVTEAQQNARAIADLIERDARTTGMMVPEAAAFCGFDAVNASDVVALTDADAIDPQNATQLGLGAPIVAGYNGGSTDDLQLGTPQFGGGRFVIDGFPFYDNDNDGVAEADFIDNAVLGQQGGVIVTDRANPARGTACGLVTDLNDPDLSVDYTIGGLVAAANAPQLQPLQPGMDAPDLLAVPAHLYWIQNNQLFRNGLRLSDDVEDLQFAAFYDLDGDGQVTAANLEYPGDPAGPQWQTQFWDNSALRELRLNLVVLTSDPDPDVVRNPNLAQGFFQVTENRVDPTGGVPDGFRRRVHTVTIRPRNVGLRAAAAGF